MNVRFVSFHNKNPEGHAVISQNIIKSVSSQGVITSQVVTHGATSIKGMFSTLNAPRSGPADIVHVLNINEFYATLSRCTSKAKIVKHVFYPYLGRVRDMPKSVAYLRIALLRSNQIDHIITINRGLLQYLKSSGVSSKKMHYVPPPINTECFRPMSMNNLRSKYNIPAASKLLLYVGQIEDARGVFTLVKAFSQLTRHMPDATLLICSPEVPYEVSYRLQLIDQIKKLNLINKVIMWGRSPAIEEVYNLADVVVLPFTEPYSITDPPLVVLEAMACGKAVVTTPVGAINDVAINGTNAMLTETRDDEQLANVLHDTLKSNATKIIGEEARRTVEKRFSISAVGEKMVNVYNQVIAD